jgi:lipopolysaccharide transport system ATP-binding protein
MMARLLFAMATAINRDILLMDEWLSVGDSDFSRKASIRINNFANKSSMIVLASHDTEMVRRICNKCLRLDYGSQIMFGDTEDVLR